MTFSVQKYSFRITPFKISDKWNAIYQLFRSNRIWKFKERTKHKCKKNVDILTKPIILSCLKINFGDKVAKKFPMENTHCFLLTLNIKYCSIQKDLKQLLIYLYPCIKLRDPILVLKIVQRLVEAIEIQNLSHCLQKSNTVYNV